MKIIILIIAVSLTALCNKPEQALKACREGAGLYLKKDLKGAEASLRRSVEYDDRQRDAYLLLAKIYYFQEREGDFIGAMKAYQELAGGNIDGLKLLAKWHIRRNEPDSARDILKRALEISGEEPGILFLLGRAYSLEGDYRMAVLTYKRGLGNYTCMKGMHQRLREIYDKLGLDMRSDVNRKMLDAIAAFQESRE